MGLALMTSALFYSQFARNRAKSGKKSDQISAKGYCIGVGMRQRYFDQLFSIFSAEISILHHWDDWKEIKNEKKEEKNRLNHCDEFIVFLLILCLFLPAARLPLLYSRYAAI